ncbi:right-handed parallel beta-helix repeat-containing protein [Halorussus litoreus]|uniref:right-handed parallel beta-helix repeat-containing protein n=1 Tax=Halorussus litoreus TaxID=1710536 RepID=UPI0013008151|nr:right-handed parallel beta-helix repeat-containing protein [Halorussus litoreus]
MGQSTADITFVEDDVTESTTWSPEDGPYRIAADVTVRKGATLTLEPGTTVQSAEDITITVRGNLTANGTAGRPVTFTTAPQAPGSTDWASIRYDGTSQSRLSLDHATIRNARDGITLASKTGTVAVTSSTIRDIERNAIRAAGTSGTPGVTVADSTFSEIGDRAVMISPGDGAIADSRIVPNRSDLGERAFHNASVTPSADTTFRTIRFEYRTHGSVDPVDLNSIRRFGIDEDDDDEIERFLNSSITSIGRPSSDVLAITLDRDVTLPAGETLIANYTDVLNPETYGTYPVKLRLQRDGVDQISPTTLPLDVRTSPDRPRATGDPQPERASWLRITDSTFQSVDGQGVFVAANVAAHVDVDGNTLSGVQGSGVTVRSERLSSASVDRNRVSRVGAGGDGVRLTAQRITGTTVNRNRVTDANAGIRLTTRNHGLDEVRVASNTVTDSTTGLAVHGRTGYIRSRISMAVVNNAFTNNARHGIAVTGRDAHLGRTEVRGNELTENGRNGLRIAVEQVTHSTLTDNTVADNGNHGLSMQTGFVVHNVSVDANRVLDNAGVGLDFRNRLTHAGSLTLSENTVAANAYGVRVVGSLNTSIENNSIVYNTYGFGSPDELRGYEPNSGIIVEEGPGGALFEATGIREELEALVDEDDDVYEYLPRHSDEPYTVVLQRNAAGEIRRGDGSAFSVASVSTDIPTGIALQKGDERRPAVNVTGNNVYGHDRGLVVNVDTLVDANTTTRLLLDATRTVRAERNYWGAPDGPTHDSIHPEGNGDRVVTDNGWVDFIPPAESAFEPAYQRPLANLTIPSNPVRPGETVVVSGRDSTAGNRSIATYRFRIDGSTRTTADGEVAVSFDEPGNYSVSLAVEDDVGIESDADARRTINVREPPETTTVDESPETTTPDTPATTSEPTPTTAETTAQPTTPAPPEESSLFRPLFTTVGGLLGLVFYGLGLALGAYGTLQTMFASSITVSGRTINGLAGAGVLTWVGFGMFGTDGLLSVGLGGIVLWVGLVVVLWLVTRVMD